VTNTQTHNLYTVQHKSQIHKRTICTQYNTSHKYTNAQSAHSTTQVTNTQTHNLYTVQHKSQIHKGTICTQYNTTTISHNTITHYLHT